MLFKNALRSIDLIFIVFTEIEWSPSSLQTWFYCISSNFK